MNPRKEQRLPQRRKIYTPGNMFDFDESKIPDGMRYQFVATTVAGMETRNAIIAEMNGWTPVPAGRHPELVGKSIDPNACIDVGGQRLYEIPAQYYQESQEMDQFAAQHAVESQITRLGLQARQEGVKKAFKRTREAIPSEEVE